MVAEVEEAQHQEKEEEDDFSLVDDDNEQLDKTAEQALVQAKADGWGDLGEDDYNYPSPP